MREEPQARHVYTLHIISDATGTLARSVISAVLTQFPDLQARQIYHVFARGKEEVEKAVQSFGKRNNIVFYALLDPEAKQAINVACVTRKIPHHDLTGSLVQFISDHTGVLPVNKLGRLHQADTDYMERLEAMKFAAQHDDSLRLDTIDQADVVIVGLSRLSKSPTAMYMGSLGYKVANVSIAPETGFPKPLEAVKKRIVAFTIQPKLLRDIRLKRLKDYRPPTAADGIHTLKYVDQRAVIREVMNAEREYIKRDYPVLDITGMTIEEITANVLRLLGTRRKNMSYH
jgi:regulator of PEP synthase PpsR (kinase-PPPase family)